MGQSLIFPKLNMNINSLVQCSLYRWNCIGCCGANMEMANMEMEMDHTIVHKTALNLSIGAANVYNNIKVWGSLSINTYSLRPKTLIVFVWFLHHNSTCTAGIYLCELQECWSWWHKLEQTYPFSEALQSYLPSSNGDALPIRRWQDNSHMQSVLSQIQPLPRLPLSRSCSSKYHGTLFLYLLPLLTLSLPPPIFVSFNAG